MNSSAVTTREAFEDLPPRISRAQGFARYAREVLLTLAAACGVLISLITVTAAHSGLQPLVVRSGSMEPSIGTGSMVLTKRITAPEIKVGDVVTVERPDRTRVTHRVVQVKQQDGTAELILKGDANKDPDPFPVSVRNAKRVVWHIPNVGRVMAWFASAQGGFVMGCIVTAYAMRVVANRPRQRDA